MIEAVGAIVILAVGYYLGQNRTLYPWMHLPNWARPPVAPPSA